MAMLIEKELEPEIQEMINILRSSDAVDLYELPVGYVVRFDFEKFARALWDHGYRLVKGEGNNGRTGHEN